MEDEATLIREQMLETRTALTEKLESLEEQVTAKVKDTTDSVVETVETVKDAVENTVHNVSDTVEKTVETVKETFDMSRHFEEHPWVMLGGAVLVGYIGGRVLENLGPPQNATYRIPPEPNRAMEPTSYQAPPPESGPSWGAELVHALRPAMSKLAGLAIGVTAGVVGDMVRESLPEGMQQEVGQVIDDITVSLGGTPIHVSKTPKATDQVCAGMESSTRQVP